MFAYINGIVEGKNDKFAIFDVSGIGYKVYLSTIALSKLEIGTKTKVFTYLKVAEDVFDLYGFLTQEELYMFELLISVNGVGTKAGLSILSQLSCQNVAIAICTDNVKEISSAQGIGPKTAQRIILELKSKISKEALTSSDNQNIDISNGVTSGTQALMSLGYSMGEAQDMVKKVYKDGMSDEDVIREALKRSI